MKVALITGICGQDGSYLAELLLKEGYEVHGIVRRSSSINTSRIDHLYKDPHEKDGRFFLHYGDMLDGRSLHWIVDTVQPDEVYNLAAQSHVRVSFELPEYTCDVVALGTLRLLEAVCTYRADPNSAAGADVKFYQATSSEIFGNSPAPQNEYSIIDPQSPYAAAKAFAYHLVKNYRESHGLFAVNGILFNHESERRGETFVTRKITRAVGRIYYGLQTKLYLGDLEARRDWGHAEDYVRAMVLAMQHPTPGDYVVGTRESHSVKEFLERAFALIGRDWHDYVEIDPRYYRPTEVNHLLADTSLVREKLGWKPTIDFDTLVKRMARHDALLARAEKAAIGLVPLDFGLPEALWSPSDG